MQITSSQFILRRLKVILLTIALIFVTNSYALSTSASTGTQQGTNAIPPIQTIQDKKFDQWCLSNGIIQVGVQTITTPLSLGGRGVFATRSLKKGNIVASIPAELVISSEEEEEWQVSLTTKVVDLLSENEEKDKFKFWLQSWDGSGGDATASSSSSGLEIESLFNDVLASNSKEVISKTEKIEMLYNNINGSKGLITKEALKNDLKARLENFERRIPKLLRSNKTSTNNNHEDVAKWYTFVMSRSGYLGKEWGSGVNAISGIVPFFDMLNHSHKKENKNVDLISFGDCLDLFGNTDKNNEIGLNRKDMLLLLTKDVNDGDELLTQYDTKAYDNEESQIKLWLQYGIPPPTPL